MATILVDTCIWAAYFKKSQSTVRHHIDELLDEDQLVLIGPVLTELLVGFKRKAQADWVASLLEGVAWEEINWSDWKRAAELGSLLAGRGHSLPITDLVISAVAMDRGFEVYSDDPHFDLIPGLKRHSPDEH